MISTQYNTVKPDC